MEESEAIIGLCSIGMESEERSNAEVNNYETTNNYPISDESSDDSSYSSASTTSIEEWDSDEDL